MSTNFQIMCVALSNTLHDTIRCIDRSGKGIALVVDDRQHLLGTITDGDVRRAMLAGIDWTATVETILTRKASVGEPAPVTAGPDVSPEALLQLMQERAVRQIPLVDSENCVVGLVTLAELVPPTSLPVQAVIMAGGFGTRLHPLTADLPKPMLPVNGRPLLERIVEQLRQVGIRHVNVTTHFKAERIIEHFGDGHAFGVEMQYVNEDAPLGTGGALGLMPAPQEPLLVINGDILTQVDFRAMLAFHQDQHAEMSVAVRRYEVQVPYGVVECDGSRIHRLQEKPQIGFFVNAGIYLLEPSVYQLIPNGQRFNMTDLIQWLLDAGRTVISFPIREYWIDIGQHGDYAQARDDAESGRVTT
jgi:dTDP-glucose pyrophosphorylase/CBS domain-containing protein